MLKTKNITIDDNGNKLTFNIRQMPAMKAWNWCNRVLLLICGAGADIPLTDGLSGGVAYVREHGLGVLGKVDYDKAQPLLEELLAQCYRVVDKAEEQVTPQTCEAYIEDLRTLYILEREALAMSLPFFAVGATSTSPDLQNTVRVRAK